MIQERVDGWACISSKLLVVEAHRLLLIGLTVTVLTAVGCRLIPIKASSVGRAAIWPSIDPLQSAGAVEIIRRRTEDSRRHWLGVVLELVVLTSIRD